MHLERHFSVGFFFFPLLRNPVGVTPLPFLRTKPPLRLPKRVSEGASSVIVTCMPQQKTALDVRPRLAP